MKKKLINFLKIVRSWAKNSPVAFLLSLFFTIILAIPTGNQLFDMARKNYQETIGWKNNEQNLVNKLAPTQTKEYFDSVLGPPIVIKSKDKYSESYYLRRDYWVQTINDSSGRILFMSVMVCSDELKLTLNNTPLYKSVTLGKDTMDSVSSDVSETEYVLSGSTGPTYLIDKVSAINPTKYQETFFGVNDACEYDPENLLRDPYYYDHLIGTKEINIKDVKIESLRKKMPINIIGFTSPHVELKDLQSNMFIGPVYTDLRVLPGYSDAPRKY